MTHNPDKPFKYEIGETVWVYTREDEFEQTVVRDRKQEMNINYYLVHWGWEKETYLRYNENTNNQR